MGARIEIDDDVLADILRMYEAGAPMMDITAAHPRYERKTVNILVRRAGIPLRTRLEAARISAQTRTKDAADTQEERRARFRASHAARPPRTGYYTWPPIDYDARAAFLALSGKLFADDPRAIRDYGTPGRVPRPGPDISITGSTGDWCAAA